MERDEPTRLLIVRVGAMGDVLHGLPAVTALRGRMPEVRIGWAVDRRWAPLVAGTAHRLHRLDIPAWKKDPISLTMLRTIGSLRQELRQERYDVCVDLQGTLRSALITRLSGAPHRFGLAAPREPLAVWGYTSRSRPRARSVIRQACELLSDATERRISPASVSFATDESAERWAGTTVDNDLFALLIPRAGWRGKEWPPSHFIDLARRLQARGLRVLVNSPAKEEPVACEIAEAAPCERVICGLPELIALARRATVVVGGDTGPMHLAAALGRPTVALFGPTDPLRNGPDFPGARVAILRSPESVTTYRRGQAQDAGLARISAADVAETAWHLLESYDG